MYTKRVEYFAVGMAILLASCCSVNRLDAQAATGTILGTVTDSSGAAIPEASMQVRNIGTGATQVVTADAQGRFRVPDLIVGDYEVQASKTGFSTVVHKGITLTVGSQNVLDFALPVGQQQQTVTVEGQASVVETTNAAVGTYTSEQQMSELPLNGRNFEQLIQLAPGVATVQWSNNAMQGRAAEYSVAGGRPEGHAILLDDESLQSLWNNGMGSISGSSLGVEAIGEFQTLTNTYGAQFGGNGAVINAVSKSGTNSFHGSAFDFLRNTELDARSVLSTQSSPSPFRRNQFGGSLGGPVKKDKAFFFVDYEGIRQLLNLIEVATVPACNVPGVCTPTATNPATAQAIANTLAIYPLPDRGRPLLPGGITGLSTTYGNQTIHENYVLSRFDYIFSPKDSIFGRYLTDKDTEIDPYSGNPIAGNAVALPVWVGNDSSLTQFATLEERHIFSPSLVNVSRISYSRPTKAMYTATSATVGGTHPLQFFPYAGLPDGYVSPGSGITAIGSITSGPFNFVQNRFTEADDILWTHGAHSIRFGGLVSRLQTNTYNAIAANANFTFANFSAFLSGNAVSVGGNVPLPGKTAVRDYRYTELQPYVQDDWKATPKLTVNVGVRWEFMTNPYEAFNNLYGITNAATSTGYTRVPNVFASNHSWTNFDPRIGLAYDPFADHKTSFRAGFGLYHDIITIQNYQTGFGTAPPWQSVTQIGTTANPVVYPVANIGPSSALPAQSFAWNVNNSLTPYMIQYNFNIQRELASNTVLTVGYVGSHGLHLYSNIETNPPIPTVNSSGVQVFGTCCNSAGAVVANPRPNPNLSYIGQLKPIATLRYNSLQTSLNRRFSRNIQAQVSYTYSKCIDDGSFGIGSFDGSGQPGNGAIENPFNQRADRGPCGYDITNVLRVNGVYALPFHGNRFVEGWQINGVSSAYGGVPIDVQTGFDILGFVGNSATRPNYVSGCNPMAGFGTFPQWFNPTCYSLQAPGTMGNTGRNSLRGPGFSNTDLSITKNTKLTEKINLQFRAEMFNIANHAVWGLPSLSLFTSATGARNSSAGTITTTSQGYQPRETQFGLKLTF